MTLYNNKANILFLVILMLSPILIGDEFEEGNKAYKSGDYELAFNKWLSSAEQGDADAQSALGWMYERGYGVKQDDSLAILWYQKAATQGIEVAQHNLNILLNERVQKNEDSLLNINQVGTIQDGQQDKKIIQNNNTIIQPKTVTKKLSTDFMHDNLVSVVSGDRNTIGWYQKAAKQGNINAQFNLGVMYDNGYGVLQDNQKALYWYQKAAKQGDAYSQVNLGEVYIFGDKALQDMSKAKYWIQKAYENSNDKLVVEQAKKIWEKYELWKY